MKDFNQYVKDQRVLNGEIVKGAIDDMVVDYIHSVELVENPIFNEIYQAHEKWNTSGRGLSSFHTYTKIIPLMLEQIETEVGPIIKDLKGEISFVKDDLSTMVRAFLFGSSALMVQKEVAETIISNRSNKSKKAKEFLKAIRPTVDHHPYFFWQALRLVAIIKDPVLSEEMIDVYKTSCVTSLKVLSITYPELTELSKEHDFLNKVIWDVSYRGDFREMLWLRSKQYVSCFGEDTLSGKDKFFIEALNKEFNDKSTVTE